MKKTYVPVCALFIALTLIPACGYSQTKEDAIRLHHEAYALQQKPQSGADLKRSEEKFLQAIEIYKKVGDRKNAALACNSVGKIYKNWSEYDKAVEYYEKSLSICRDIKDRKDEVEPLNGLGLVYQHRGQYDKAVEYFQKSFATAKEVKDLRGEAISLGNLGLVYQNWGQYDNALKHYEKILAITKEIKDRKLEGNALSHLGSVYMAWGQYDKAAQYYEKALPIEREFKDRHSESYTLNKLGSIYQAWGQYDKAVDYFNKSFEIAREFKDRGAQSSSMIMLATVYLGWGQYDKAVDYYEKSLTICRDIKDRKGESAALHNLGIVYGIRNQYDKAVDYYQKSLNICLELKDRKGEGLSLNSLGSVYKTWGQYDKAVDYYQKSLNIRRELKDRKGEGLSLNSLGSFYQSLGQYDKAVDYYQQSLSIHLELKDRSGEGLSLVSIGEVFEQRGETKKALENFQKALDIYTEIKVPTATTKSLIAQIFIDEGDLSKAGHLISEAGTKTNYGRLFLLEKNYPTAKIFYEALLKSVQQNSNADNLFTAYTGLGAVCEGLNDNQGAMDNYEKAVKLTEEIRSTLPLAERQTFFNVKINGFTRTAPYEGLARTQTKLNKPFEALKTSEYTLARVFAESMSRSSEGRTLDVPPEIIKQDSSSTDELAALKKNLQQAYEKNNKLTIQSLEPQVKELEEKFANHVKMLREKYPLFAATKYPQPMDISQSDLKDNEWVLAYHVTDSGVIVYLTKGKNLIKGLFKPIARREVDELVRKFRNPMELTSGDSLTEKLSKFDFMSGKRLSDLLLSDILPDLPQNTPVIIVPDGSLGVVPFEMLVLNDGGRTVTENKRTRTSGVEFFGDRNPISYYQSITALTLARTLGKHQKSGEKTLAMVDPVFSADDPRLTKFAKQERDKLIANLPNDLTMSIQTESGLTFPRLALTSELGESLKKSDPQHTDLYEGLNAKKTSLINKDLTPYRSLVFGTHGYFGKDLPGIQEPVLVMSLLDQPKGQDGFLRLSEVMGLKLNCDIAALTACQTGLGRQISGEGTMGMGRAFQYAGAKSVLMSLWSVSETASVNLVESFFKHVKEGKSKLEALNLAREEIRKAGYDHPFYWASFILVGEVN